MKIRKFFRTVKFESPFKLHGFKGTLPPGQYNVEIEEQWIEGLSFVAFKRKQISLHLQVDPKNPKAQEILILSDPKELDAALLRDAQEDDNAGKNIKGSRIHGADKKSFGGSKPIHLPDDRREKRKQASSITWPIYH